uniref:mRNA binding protein n=1 Tax=Kwoniella pini CBS 10737 TaxID=1296096 RepID=A0A1B9HUU6_9TREE|nr:mRNA binding protein [Kwoniella pini CBS 10737]OCF47041.1 mRNA binding protein [Kwoniella pini CBS 10737]
MGNFGFAEFESSRDAEDVIKDFNNRPFMGENLVVQEPRESRKRDTYEARPPRNSGPPRKGVRIAVIGIPGSTSWQDLKDYGRLGGNNIIYADVDRYNPGQGIIEYPTLEEAEEAVKRLAGVDINGSPVTLEINPAGADDARRGDSDRRPPPRDFDDRRSYNRGGYDDRRAPRDYDRRDDRRDDRRNDRDYGRRDDRGDRGYDRRDTRRDDRRDGGDSYAPRDRSPRRDNDAPRREYDERAPLPDRE